MRDIEDIINDIAKKGIKSVYFSEINRIKTLFLKHGYSETGK